MSTKSILITGGTGYVGGRLIPLLREREDIQLRLMARNPDYLRARVGSEIEITHGDVMDPDSLADSLEGIDIALYLIHSMGSGSDFEDEDRRAAHNFAIAAKKAKVKRIVYLGGLGAETENLSKHLR
ncbi:MAG: NAD(P)H-binding protein, partial [Rubripirellula sp.]|nr:NAD(P)H-binding protein [Rubripirellula sp.]